MDWSWAIGGISERIPRTTGPECSNYMTNNRRLIEGVIVTICCLIAIKWAVQRMQPLNLSCYLKTHPEEPPLLGRRLLLIIMTFIFGLEMGFKFSTRSVIFVLNPCHITTIIQIYLLAAKPTKTTTALFRIQMNFLNGPLLAFVFPETDSRVLTLETFTYWLQHGLLFIIPVYLIRHGGPYKMEDIMDINWNVIGVAIMLLYHFVILNIMGVLAGVNLNHMLCAAMSDPFQGPHYRVSAIIHQTILCPMLCKLTGILFTDHKQNQLDMKIILNNSEIIYDEYNKQKRISDQQIMTTKID